MSNSTEPQRKPIKDRLGGEKSLPIRLVRESLWETDNPFIKLCRTYPGQIVIAVITYYLFKQVLGAWLMNVLISWALNSNIVPEKALLATVTYSDIIMLASLGLLVMVMFIGSSVNNAQRWISVFGVRITPSEFSKVAMIIFTSAFLAKDPDNIRSFRGLFVLFTVMIAHFFLIVRQPNLSTAIVIVFIMGALSMIGVTL